MHRSESINAKLQIQNLQLFLLKINTFFVSKTVDFPYMCINRIWHKKNLQELICHKIQSTNQPTNRLSFALIKIKSEKMSKRIFCYANQHLSVCLEDQPSKSLPFYSLVHLNLILFVCMVRMFLLLYSPASLHVSVPDSMTH